MNTLFNMENPVVKFLSRAFDVAYLNLLFVICCIPLITIGSSATALYYCMLKISRDSDSSITRMFFHSLKRNLKQGILLTLIFVGVLVVLLVDIQACNVSESAAVGYFKLFLYVMCGLLAVIASFSFPMLAQFENSIRNILKNSLIMAVSHFNYAIFIVVLSVAPVMIFLFSPELFLQMSPIWISCGFALIALINSKAFVKIFDKYISHDDIDVQEPENLEPIV